MAFQRQAHNVKYADYKDGEDFTLWLSGYRERIRNAFGFNATQDADVNAEVVRSISGKLQVGTPLDAYNTLPAEVKNDYDRLIRKLTEEYIDPQEQERFVENLAYNKRKAGQSLKEFQNEIKKDQNKYLDMKDMIGEGDAATINLAKVHDGIRRFKKGLRDRKGNFNESLNRHVKLNLCKNADFTWENALDSASRWEAANDFSDIDSSDASDNENDRGSPVEATKIVGALESSAVFTSLVKRVEANEKNIEDLQIGQERLSATVNSQFNEIKEMFQSMAMQSSYDA